MKTDNVPLILIIDDVYANLQLLGNILQEHHFDVSFAMNGKEALKILDSITPHLILCDIMMPEMDGIELCKIIKANPQFQKIPFIFLTAKAEIEDVLQGFETGAVDYITKPFNSVELIARVHVHLRYAFPNLQIEGNQFNQN